MGIDEVKEIANPKGLFPIVITVTKISRIKRVVWSDFDRSIECFSVGVEGTPHNSEHPYRVMDNLAFSLICPAWNADEESLLEGIEIYGSRNWSEVAEHVGIKSKAQCINHYNATICMNSPFFPLLDLSHVMKKSREELLAMAKELKKEVPMLGEVTVEEESPFQSESQIGRIKQRSNTSIFSSLNFWYKNQCF
nr:transcriptional adapter ADA2-like [Ziziphus jujuba var. spinosa]